MMRIAFFLLTCFLSVHVSGQEDSIKYLVNSGVNLHDKGRYDEAIVLFDRAIKLDPLNYLANYEKSFSLYASNRYQLCIELSKQMLQDFKSNPELKAVYVNYGSSLDNVGKPAEALQIYEQGIEAFPDFYLLPYNKGLTYYNLGKRDEALLNFQKALMIKPTHASSNNAIGVVLEKSNPVPAFLADVVFLLQEMSGERAKSAVQRMLNALTANVSKGENGATVISISGLDDGKKSKENNFSMVELMMSLMAGLDEKEPFKSENASQRLLRKLDLIISSLKENNKGSKGFYWSHYVPFFIEMKKKEFTAVVARLCYYSSGEADLNSWMQQNESQVKSFYKWLEEYQWK